MDMHFDGVIFHTYADELARRMDYPYPPFSVLDVRSLQEHAKSRIPGSVRLDTDGLEALPADTGAATELFVVGSDHTDPRVRQAALALRRLGARRVVEVTGGYHEWRRRGLPENTDQNPG